MPIVEGHLNLTLLGFARWALLFLHQGRNLAGEQVVPEAWVDGSLSPSTARRAALLASDGAATFESGQYHNQLWQIDPHAGIVAMLGIHGQFALLDVPYQLILAGLCSYPVQLDGLMTATRAPVVGGMDSSASRTSVGLAEYPSTLRTRHRLPPQCSCRLVHRECDCRTWPAQGEADLVDRSG